MNCKRCGTEVHGWAGNLGLHATGGVCNQCLAQEYLKLRREDREGK